MEVPDGYLRSDPLPPALAVEVVEHRLGAGSDWVATRLSEVAKWPTRAVAAAASGPVASLETQLRSTFGDLLLLVSDKELQQGCGSIGDAWRWTRKSSTVDISATVGWFVHGQPAGGKFFCF